MEINISIQQLPMFSRRSIRQRTIDQACEPVAITARVRHFEAAFFLTGYLFHHFTLIRFGRRTRPGVSLASSASAAGSAQSSSLPFRTNGILISGVSRAPLSRRKTLLLPLCPGWLLIKNLLPVEILLLLDGQKSKEKQES